MVFKELEIIEKLSDDEILNRCKNTQRRKKELIRTRSSLMVSANNLKHLNKLDELDADIAIINLEDGVAKEQKKRALLLASLFISNLKESSSYISVRINPLNEGGDKEIELLNNFLPDCIRVPKIGDAKDVERALTLIDPKIDIALSIETKEAFSAIKELVIDKRVKLLYLGILDLLNSLGLKQSSLKLNNPTINYILSKFLVEAKIAQTIPVSFVYQDFRDLDGFKSWCILEKEMGFNSKSCISPMQVKIANEIFSDSLDEIERAKEIKILFEESAKKGITGFVSQKYGFIDEPIYKDALLVLSRFGG